MVNPKCSFYKYSHSDTLSLYATRNICDKQGNKIETQNVSWIHISKLEEKWDDIEAVDQFYHQLLVNLFKNIKTLEIGAYSMHLLHKLPLSILFNSQSNLCKAKFAHCPEWDEIGAYTSICEFDKQYQDLKHEAKQTGQQLKKLQLVEHIVPQCFGLRRGCKIHGPAYIDTVHLSIKRMNITHGNKINHLFANIKILTLINRFTLDESDLEEMKYNGEFDICTLRLINFLHTHDGYHGDLHLNNSSICDNEQLIKKLNLQSSLKNLTMNINFGNDIMESDWIQGFKNIFTKNHFYNLNNVNILLETEMINIQTFFDILKENLSVLKYQFKQLNIGLRVYDALSVVDGKEVYYVFEWNANINDNILMKKQEEIMKQLMNMINVKQTLSPNMNRNVKDRYYELQQQIEWC